MPKVIVRANAETQQVQIEVEGAVGQACTDITKQFEDAMGMITSTEKKREFYQTTENQTYQ